MYIIEYISLSPDQAHRKFYSELALGSTAEEARDQADTHLKKMAAEYGACGYRIFDKDKQCVAIGPEGFQGG